MRIAWMLTTIGALLIAALPARAIDPVAAEKQDHLTIGAGALLQIDPFIGSDDSVYPVPYVSLKKGMFYIETTEAGLSVDLGDDSAPSLDGYVVARWTSGQDREKLTADAGARLSIDTDLGRFSIEHRRDITGTFDGGETIARWAAAFRTGKVSIIPGLQLSWLDQRTADYMYGITARQNARMIAKGRDPVLAPYRIDDDALNFGGDVSVFAEIAERMTLIGSFAATHLDKSIRRNPGIGRDWDMIASLSLAYDF